MLRSTGFPPGIAHGNNLCAELRAPDSRILWAATPHFAVLTLARLRRNVKKPFLIKRTGTEFRNGTANTPDSRRTLTRSRLCITCSPRRCAFHLACSRDRHETRTFDVSMTSRRQIARIRSILRRCREKISQPKRAILMYLPDCEPTSARRIAMVVRSSRCRKLSRNIGLNNGNQRSMHKHVPLISRD